MKRAAGILLVILFCAWLGFAQRVAVLEPERDGPAVPGFTDALRSGLALKVKLIDDGLAASAHASVTVADPFNMTADEGRRAGAVIGCDRILILRSALQRRAASGGRSYVEAYAVTYLVDSRSGSLIRFDLTAAEAETEAKAAAGLIAKVPALVSAIAEARFERSEAAARFPESPPENSPDAAGLKMPVPYKRIRPEYTTLASLYGVKATVDAEADIDSNGNIDALRIVRWAGFGLDGSVESAIRSMNWRPAMRAGKALPMRVLLRYNFRKIEQDEEN